MANQSQRKLPNARLRRFLLAVQEIMGPGGLATVLRQAGLQRYAAELPPDNIVTAVDPAEYAAVMQAIENYFGRGARGMLQRIGQAAFRQLLAAQRMQAGMQRAWYQVLPEARRQESVLSWLAREMAAPGGRVVVVHEGSRLVLEDYESDASRGRNRDSQICWVTLGEVQEALQWATGVETQVTEISCRAKGDDACRFEVGHPLH